MENIKDKSNSIYPSAIGQNKSSSSTGRFLYRRRPLNLSNLPADDKMIKSLSFAFVFYRILLVIIFSIVLFLALNLKSRNEEELVDSKHFPLYLTYWGMILNEISVVYAALLYSFIYYKRSFASYNALEKFLSIYRILHHTSTVISSFITFLYWLFIHDTDMVLDFFCITTHIISTPIMLTDFVLSSLCYHYSDVIYPVCLALIYSAFTVIYYVSGGTDGKGHKYIYNIIDWSKPKHTFLYLSAFTVMVVLIHLLLWAVSGIKTFIRTSILRMFSSKPNFETVEIR